MFEFWLNVVEQQRDKYEEGKYPTRLLRFTGHLLERTYRRTGDGQAGILLTGF